MAHEIIQTISRVRRAMPRNSDVMELCDELERLLLARSSVVERGAVNARVGGSTLPVPAKPVLSRADIQRNYRLRKKGKL